MSKIKKTTFMLKRGTEEAWRAANPILREAEPGFVIDKNKLKIGDGVTDWNNLSFLTPEEQDVYWDKIVNAPVNNEYTTVEAEYGLAEGYNTQSGMRGYPITTQPVLVDTSEDGKRTFDFIINDDEDKFVTKAVSAYSIYDIVQYAGVNHVIDRLTIIGKRMENGKSILTIQQTDNGDIRFDFDQSFGGYIFVAEKNVGIPIILNTAAHAEGEFTVAAGRDSHAEGLGSQAIGYYSHAEGLQTRAAHAAHSEGRLTKAIGQGSHAEGSDTSAMGPYTHAEGNETLAQSSCAHAEGARTKAIGSAAHSEGTDTQAIGSNSHAEGSETIAKGNGAHAEGKLTEANNSYAHAEGYRTKAEGYAAHSEGYGTVADGNYQHVEGIWNEPMGNEYLHVLGNGVDEQYRSNAHTIDKYGNAWFSGQVYAGQDKSEQNRLVRKAELPAQSEPIGRKGTGSLAEIFNVVGNEASGDYSHAEGYLTKSQGAASHAEGSTTVASGRTAHAEGAGTQASGEYSHAEGSNTVASGYYSHAEGNSAQANASGAHAEGQETKANGTNSHAEGYQSTADGERSHAEGWASKTKAGFRAAHAEGKATQANNTAAHSEGEQTIASGAKSHAEGTYTEAASENQHVQGKYNVVDVSGTYAHIVGNGASSSKRSNAHTLDWNGNAWFAGDVTVGPDGERLAKMSDIPQTPENVGIQWTESTEHPGCFFRMVDGFEEWLNPPMKSGMIYRTTKRAWGKPVYATLFICPPVIPTAGGEKWITMPSIDLWDEKNQSYSTLMIDSVVGIKGFITYAGAVFTTFDDPELVSNYYIDYGGIGSGTLVIDYASTAYNKIQDWGGSCSIYAIIEFTGWF